MAKKDRNGERKKRGQSKSIRVPKLGYYMIVTDTEGTERCYFDGLHDSLPEKIQNNLVIKVVETKTTDLVDKCISLTTYDAQYREPWIVFDRDQVKDFDEIIKKAEAKGIKVGWSNPCFEIWMFAYYGNMPNITNSWSCCDKFGELYERKTKIKYDKAEKSLYKKLLDSGDEENAIKIAATKNKHCLDSGYSKPSEMIPCTTVYKLVSEIKGKCSEQ